MALEAVVFAHNLLENNEVGGGSRPWWWSKEDGNVQPFNEKWEASCSSMQHQFDDVNACSSNPTMTMAGSAAGKRKKRRRSKISKNREIAENQRMTHIAVERSRRKQMNDLLAVLRSLMPPSYVPRSDQASIIGSAINFIKELEHFLHPSEVQNQLKQQPPTVNIKVAVMEGHASLKVLLRRRPKQLLQLVMGLQSLQLSTLHLNVTTIEPMTLYSFSLKVEDGCPLNSVDEIAVAVHRIVGKMEQESGITGI